MQIRDLAKRCGISVELVRYYVRLGMLRPKRAKTSKDERLTEDDIGRLLFISRARKLGFTLKEIRTILEESQTDNAACPHAWQIIQRRIAENQKRVYEELTLQMRMEQVLAQWQCLNGAAPTGRSLWRLVESFRDDRENAGEHPDVVEGAESRKAAGPVSGPSRRQEGADKLRSQVR